MLASLIETQCVNHHHAHASQISTWENARQAEAEEAEEPEGETLRSIGPMY